MDAQNDKRCVVMSVNDKYVPYLCVLIQSLINNKKNNYICEIVILYRQLMEDNINIIRSICRNFSDIKVNFINVGEIVANYTLFISGSHNDKYISEETYYRLLLPEIITDFSKVLYLDCDIILRRGWDDIFDIDIATVFLAAIPDIWDNLKYTIFEKGIEKYRNEELEIYNMEEYFNAGVLLLNLEYFRNNFSSGDLMELAASRNWKKHDQDLLNMICKDSKLLLDYEWNVIECIDERVWNTLDDAQKDYYISVRSRAKIIHYAARKPWKELEIQDANLFWQYAAQTPVFIELLKELINNQLNGGTFIKNKIYASLDNNELGIKFIIKCIYHMIRSFKKREKKDSTV